MTDAVLLDAQNIVKHYGSVEALRGASFQARAGEVTALIGDNGAGKSTLIKCLSGAEQPTSGRILLDGKEMRFDSPTTARRLGIETVYQDLAVAPELDRPQTCSWAGKSTGAASSASSGCSTRLRCGGGRSRSSNGSA